MNVNVSMRASKVKADGFGPVEFSISSKGLRVMFKVTDYQFSMFNKKSGRKLQEDLKRKAADLYGEFMARGIDPTPVQLKEAFLHGFPDESSDGPTIRKVFDQAIAQKELECNRGLITFKSYRKYCCCRDEFFKMVDPSAPALSVNTMVCRRFLALLQGKYLGTTVAGYFEKFRAILRAGVDAELIPKNPAVGIKVKRPKENVTTITVEEYESIRDKDLYGIERLEKVRDLFIFQCCSGMAYCDMAALDEKDFQRDADGLVFVKKSRKKTGVPFTAPILEDGVKVLEKYGYHLPILSNAKFNLYLKEIQTVCQVNSVPSLHTHLARHFYITRLLNLGIPITQVARSAGHTRVEQTMQYCDVRDEELFKSVKRLAV